MPAAKKQKTARDSGVFLEESGSESSDSAFESVRPNKSDKQKKNKHNSSTGRPADPAPYDYVCIPHPFFDVEGRNYLNWTLDPDAFIESKSEIFDKLYKPIDDKFRKDGLFKAPASKHPEHKWVMLWDAWLKADLLGRKAKYCNPDAFEMNLYTDWQGWGMQEIMENMMVEFNQGFHAKKDRLEKMWSVISALGLWLNEEERVDALVHNEDGDTTCDVIGLMGCALLTILAAVEAAGELKPDSRFLDLTIAISYYLELSHDLPAYGIDGESVLWRKEAVNYFKEGKLDPEKGTFATKLRLDELSKVGDVEDDFAHTIGNIEKIITGTTELERIEAERVAKDPAGISAENPVTIPEDDDTDKENTNPKATGEKNVSSAPATTAKGKRKRGPDNIENAGSGEKDPWHWDEKFKAYKASKGKMGGEHYDITKMSSADRAAASFTGKDPLADIPVEDLKENLLDFA
ncbi:hypothetical protein J4E91_005479 [Alternaria rosae]|nr:hypothetical protein J4E91_005479 [Alternaria rosae]